MVKQKIFTLAVMLMLTVLSTGCNADTGPVYYQGLKIMNEVCLTPDETRYVCVSLAEREPMGKVMLSSFDFNQFVEINNLPADTTPETMTELNTYYIVGEKNDYLTSLN
jgi:hypothetical protein